MPSLPSGTGKYAAHVPHYDALGLHYASLRPTALGQHNAALGQHNVTLGRHIFPYPSAGVAYCSNGQGETVKGREGPQQLPATPEVFYLTEWPP